MLLVTMASSSFTLSSDRAADIAGADVMIVGKDAGHFAIEIDALHPILLPRSAPAAPASALRVRIDRRRRRRFLAEIGADVLP